MENRHERLGKQAYERSNDNLWVVALHAFYVPNYAEFGRELARSRETVRRWAAAYMMYRELRHISVTLTRRIRHALSVTHFSKLAELWKRYEFSMWQALDYLELAMDNGWSPELMASEIVATEEDQPYRDWISFTSTLRTWSEKLGNGYVPHDVPDELKERASYLAGELDVLARDVDRVREGYE